MNILFVVPYAPTLIRTRPYNLIRNLVRRGNTVTIASLWENAEEFRALREFEASGIQVIDARLTKRRSIWNSLWALPTQIPLQAVYCWQSALLRKITPQLERARFDAIHVEHLRGARYGLWLKSQLEMLEIQTPIIWDSVDCISYLFAQAAQNSRSLFGRWITRLELERTRRYESWLPEQFDGVLMTSPIDRAEMEQLVREQRRGTSTLPETRISVLPNGVDLEYFRLEEKPRDVENVVITGKMSYHANITAALYLVNDIMPRVWAKRPTIRVTIAGKDPSHEIMSLVARYPSLVAVTGAVPDIRPYLGRAAVAVSPVAYGAGIQNKVLEAMAMGTPVVASSQAVSALQARDGEHLLVGNGVEGFAQAVLRLLEDRELQARIGRAGRRYVEGHHDWLGIVQRLEEFYGSSLGRERTVEQGAR